MTSISNMAKFDKEITIAYKINQFTYQTTKAFYLTFQQLTQMDSDFDFNKMLQTLKELDNIKE